MGQTVLVHLGLADTLRGRQWQGFRGILVYCPMDLAQCQDLHSPLRVVLVNQTSGLQVQMHVGQPDSKIVGRVAALHGRAALHQSCTVDTMCQSWAPLPEKILRSALQNSLVNSDFHKIHALSRHM